MTLTLRTTEHVSISRCNSERKRRISNKKSEQLIRFSCSDFFIFVIMKKILLILSTLLIVAGCIKEEQRGSDLKVGDMIPDFEV